MKRETTGNGCCISAAPGRLGTILTALVGAVVLVATPFDAMGQRKQEPPAPVQKPTGPSPEFLEAYRALRMPKLAVSVVAVGASGLILEGDVQTLEARLTEQFNDPDVTLIEVTAADLRANREFETMLANNAEAAGGILANQVKSDYLILVSLIEQFGRADGVRFRAAYYVIDGNRGTKVGSWSWDMKPENPDGTYTARQLGKYAISISERVTKDFQKLTRPGQGAKFTLRLVNLADDQVRAFTNALKSVAGVGPNIRRSQERGGQVVLTTLELSYAGGDSFDLQDEVRALVMGMDPQSAVRTWVSQEGVITLELTTRPKASITDLLNGEIELGDADSTRTAEVAKMRRAYDKAGRPRIALMVNRRATDASAMERGDRSRSGADPMGPAGLPPGAAGGTTIVVYPIIVESRDRDPRATDPQADGANQPPDGRLLLTREIEDRMLRRMGNGLKLDMVEASNAVDQVLKEQRVQERVFGEHELVELLAAKEVADVLILGVGMVLPAGARFEIRYTFRAYNVKNSKVLATATVSESVEYKDPRLNEILNQVNDSVSAKAVGELTYFMRERWLPPSAVIIEISNVKSVAGMDSAMEWFRKLPAVTTVVDRGGFRAGEQGGVGTFEVVYDTDFGEFKKLLARADAPFTLEGQDVSQELVKLKALDK